MTTVVGIGSRSGGVASLLFFTVLFGVLGAMIARELRRRGGTPPVSRTAGIVFFAGPLALVFVSSLSGLYDVEVTARTWTLRALLPSWTTTVPVGEIRDITAVPAYRGSWRLQVVTAEGRHDSASASRATVEAARTHLHEMSLAELR